MRYEDHAREKRKKWKKFRKTCPQKVRKPWRDCMYTECTLRNTNIREHPTADWFPPRPRHALADGRRDAHHAGDGTRYGAARHDGFPLYCWPAQLKFDFFYNKIHI